MACANLARRGDAAAAPASRLAARIGVSATPITRVALVLLGVLLAAGVWLTRYDLLLKDNAAASIKRGAEYLDVTGLFSNLNYITVTTLVVLGVTLAGSRCFAA